MAREQEGALTGYLSPRVSLRRADFTSFNSAPDRTCPGIATSVPNKRGRPSRKQAGGYQSQQTENAASKGGCDSAPTKIDDVIHAAAWVACFGDSWMCEHRDRTGFACRWT